jgi:hypothetical protein
MWMTATMRQAAPAVILVIGVTFLYVPTTQAELWRCVQKNQTEMFTDRPTVAGQCEPYNAIQRPVRSGPLPRTIIQRGLDFRGVRPAMTENEVLAHAGYPNRRYTQPCAGNGRATSCPKRWVYNYSDKGTVEVLLEKGRVAEIKNLPRP